MHQHVSRRTEHFPRKARDTTIPSMVSDQSLSRRDQVVVLQSSGRVLHTPRPAGFRTGRPLLAHLLSFPERFPVLCVGLPCRGSTRLPDEGIKTALEKKIGAQPTHPGAMHLGVSRRTEHFPRKARDTTIPSMARDQSLSGRDQVVVLQSSGRVLHTPRPAGFRTGRPLLAHLLSFPERFPVLRGGLPCKREHPTSRRGDKDCP